MTLELVESGKASSEVTSTLGETGGGWKVVSSKRGQDLGEITLVSIPSHSPPPTETLSILCGDRKLFE